MAPSRKVCFTNFARRRYFSVRFPLAAARAHNATVGLKFTFYRISHIFNVVTFQLNRLCSPLPFLMLIYAFMHHQYYISVEVIVRDIYAAP